MMGVRNIWWMWEGDDGCEKDMMDVRMDAAKR